MSAHTQPSRKPSRMRPRDDDSEEENQPAHSSAHVSPAMRIYRHTLESIFAMLELHDLSRVLAVSRSWSAAVISMKPICDSFDWTDWLVKLRDDPKPFPAVLSLVASPLMRHLGEFIFRLSVEQSLSAPLDKKSLALLAQHAPNLTSLWCSVSPASTSAPWLLPAKLTSLQLDFSAAPTAADINALFVIVTGLVALTRLCLMVADAGEAPGVDFSLLATAPALIDFSYKQLDESPVQLLAEQGKQIHTALGHLQRIAIEHGDYAGLRRLLMPPVTARWQDIDRAWVDPNTEKLLLTLPTLTRLNLRFVMNRPHLDFLAQFPQLKSLELDSKYRDDDGFFVHPAALLQSLLPCTGITELDLNCGFSSAQWSELFAKLTSLTKLTICGGLESLQCFASGPVTQTLGHLTLYGHDLLVSELAHLYPLAQLRYLGLDCCFCSSPDAATIDSLAPPTAIFPKLIEVFWQWEVAEHYNELDIDVRTGPSFEWMQKRLTT